MDTLRRGRGARAVHAGDAPVEHVHVHALAVAVPAPVHDVVAGARARGDGDVEGVVVCRLAQQVIIAVERLRGGAAKTATGGGEDHTIIITVPLLQTMVLL